MLSLLDATPEIDGDAGKVVDDLEGDMKLEGVEFHYQARPNQKVGCPAANRCTYAPLR